MKKYAHLLIVAEEFEKAAMIKQAFPIMPIITAVMMLGPMAGQVFSGQSGEIEGVIEKFVTTVEEFKGELEQAGKYSELNSLANDLKSLISGSLEPSSAQTLEYRISQAQNTLSDVGGLMDKVRAVADSLGVGLLIPSKIRTLKDCLDAVVKKLPKYLEKVKSKLNEVQADAAGHAPQSTTRTPQVATSQSVSTDSESAGIGSMLSSVFRRVGLN